MAIDPELLVNVASLADVIRSKEAADFDKDRAALPCCGELWRSPPAEPPFLLHIVSTFGVDADVESLGKEF